MADRDIIHPKLPALWQEVYAEICENFFPPEVCADDIMQPLIKTIKGLGSEPVALLIQAASVLDEIPTGPLTVAGVDWVSERLKIEKLGQSLRGKRRGISFAVEACKAYLYELEQGRYGGATLKELAFRYMVRVYDAEFEARARVPLPSHYCNADPQLVERRLSEMRPFVMVSIDQVAVRIARTGGVGKLQTPSRHGEPPIDLDTDLSGIVSRPRDG